MVAGEGGEVQEWDEDYESLGESSVLVVGDGNLSFSLALIRVSLPLRAAPHSGALAVPHSGSQFMLTDRRGCGVRRGRGALQVAEAGACTPRVFDLSEEFLPFATPMRWQTLATLGRRSPASRWSPRPSTRSPSSSTAMPRGTPSRPSKRWALGPQTRIVL